MLSPFFWSQFLLIKRKVSMCPNPVASATTYCIIRAEMRGCYWKHAHTHTETCTLWFEHTIMVDKNTYSTYTVETQASSHSCMHKSTRPVEADTYTNAHTLTQRYLMFSLFEAKFLLSLLAPHHAPFPGFLRTVQAFQLRAIVYVEANSLRTSDILTEG